MDCLDNGSRLAGQDIQLESPQYVSLQIELTVCVNPTYFQSHVETSLKQVLGSAGTIQTVSYSVNPRYSSTPGQAAVIVGYTASNTLQVTTIDLSLIGSLIDTANQAGANNVGGLQFSLRDPEPLRQQAPIPSNFA